MKEQLATRVEAPIRQRLRVYAAISRQTIAAVVSAALDGYLPPLTEMVRATDSDPGGSRAVLASAPGGGELG